MRNTKFFTPLRLLLLAALLVSLLTSFAVGKYIQTQSIESKVTFSVSLAENVVLQESEAVRNEDGSYTLNTNKTVNANTYTLIPGLDIPKDPHIIIEGKTNIPAYLFIEVVDATDNKALRYGLLENWIKSDLKDPQYKGTIYAYSTDKENPAEITENLTAYILVNNIVYVDHALLSGDASDALTFYTYLEEIPPETNP